MRERTKAIKKYYNDLEYNAPKYDREKALMKISALTKTIKTKNVNYISMRLLETLPIIKENFCLFASACGHVDIVNSIIRYLYHYGWKYTDDPSGKQHFGEIWLLMCTLFNMCAEHEVQLFLRTAIIKDWEMDPFGTKFETLFLNPNIEIIILEDSDLYAVISHLMIVGKCPINKILVQESITKEFLSLLKKYIKHMCFSIHMFRSKQELFTPCNNKLSIVSMWSEDIIAAKNLAKSFTQELVFINTYIDFHSSITLLPFQRGHVPFPILKKRYVLKPADIKSNVAYPTYNLFYNGTWHKPVQNEYSIYNNCKCPDATKEDFTICIESAKKGHKIWSSLSIDSRKRILSKLASVLGCNGKFRLSKLILVWLKFICIKNELSLPNHSKRLEVEKVYESKGVIYILESDEHKFFQKLILTLIFGNSVIVITTTESYNILPYCDMFSTSEIPPGVINVISCKNFEDVDQYIGTNDTKELYTSLTNSRTIILSVQ